MGGVPTGEVFLGSGKEKNFSEKAWSCEAACDRKLVSFSLSASSLATLFSSVFLFSDSEVSSASILFSFSSIMANLSRNWLLKREREREMLNFRF